MSVDSRLKSDGWYLSPEGIAEISENDENISIKDIVKKALDIDLKNIGCGVIPEDVAKGKKLPDLCVLQVVKITNVSAPKINEESTHAPRLLKIVLTDGLATCTALDLQQLKTIDVHTPPGTKVRLKGSNVSCKQGYLFLTNTNIEVLGGKVDALIEKWKLKESLVNIKRSKLIQDGGPPPWVPFGKKITGDVQDLTGKFKSLDTAAAKEAKENDAFESQRKATIAEIAKAKAAGSKTFGGGKQASEKEAAYTGDRYSKPKFGSGSNSTTGASDKPVSFTRGGETGGGGGGSGGGNNTTSRGERGAFQSSRGGRPERSGRGRGRRDDGDEDGVMIAPSRPSTLFDFLQSKIDSIEGKAPSDGDDMQDQHHTTNSFDMPRDNKSHSAPYENRRQQYGGRDSGRDGGRDDWKRPHNDLHDSNRHRGGGSRGGFSSSSSSSYRGSGGGGGGGGRGARTNDYNSYGRGTSRFSNDRQHNSSSTTSTSYSKRSDNERAHAFTNPTSTYGNNRHTSDQVSSSSDRPRSGTGATFSSDSHRALAVNSPTTSGSRGVGGARSDEATSQTTTTSPATRTAVDSRSNVVTSSGTTTTTTANYDGARGNDNVTTKSTFISPNTKFPTERLESRSPGNQHQHQRTGSVSNRSRDDNDAYHKMTCPPMPDFDHAGFSRADYQRPPPTSATSNNRTGGANHFAGGDPGHAARNSHQLPPPSPYLMHQAQQPLHVNVNYQPSLSGFKGNNANALLTSQQADTPGVTRAWQGGDVCMAKYWEDNKHYPAVVHAVGPTGTTCVVLFTKYGNYEEVFVEDMKPWKSKEEQGNYQMNTGTVEFRRGGTRPYVVRHNFSHQLDQDHFRQSSGRPTQQVYVPPAQRQ